MLRHLLSHRLWILSLKWWGGKKVRRIKKAHKVRSSVVDPSRKSNQSPNKIISKNLARPRPPPSRLGESTRTLRTPWMTQGPLLRLSFTRRIRKIKAWRSTWCWMNCHLRLSINALAKRKLQLGKLRPRCSRSLLLVNRPPLQGLCATTMPKIFLHM